MTACTDSKNAIIHIAAGLLLRPDGRTLLVRKRGTQAFMQAGGKIEARESPAVALARELEEELGLQVDPAQARFLGQFSAPAANEPGYVVQAEVFLLEIDAEVAPAAEIEEVCWVDLHSDINLHLAPLTRDLILPFYRASLTPPA